MLFFEQVRRLLFLVFSEICFFEFDFDSLGKFEADFLFWHAVCF